MTPTQPTTDEVERIAREILDAYETVRVRELSKQYPNRGYEFKPQPWERVSENERDMCLTMAQWHLTHSAKLRAENEGLKSQNAVMLEALLDLKSQAMRVSGGPPDYMAAIQKAYDLLSTLPTTPNLVERVRELENQIKELLTPLNMEGFPPGFVEEMQAKNLNQKAE